MSRKIMALTGFAFGFMFAGMLAVAWNVPDYLAFLMLPTGGIGGAIGLYTASGRAQYGGKDDV